MILLTKFLHAYHEESLSFLKQIPYKSKNNNLLFFKEIIPTIKTEFVHSPSITAIDKNHLLITYSAGTQEGAEDVKIYSNIYDIHKKKWTKPRAVLNRKRLFQDSHWYIRKLGNAVVYQSNQVIYLFVVAPSFSNWASSRIYSYRSDDKGKTFQYQNHFNLSPFANLSTLVRTQPIRLLNKGFLLPVYHEFETYYPFFLEFDALGQFIKPIKINEFKNQIQPSIIALSQKNCLIAFRNHNLTSKSNHLLKVQFCRQLNKQWPLAIDTNINNEDDSINLIHFNNEIYLIHPRNENKELVLSKFDLKTNKFILLKVLDSSNHGYISYPNTIRLNSSIHIVYRKNKQIMHIMLNDNFINGIKK